MSKTKAWRLEWPLQPLALATCEVIEIVDEPEIHRVPAGPSWCRALLFWRNQLIPLALSDRTEVNDLHVVVVAYQMQPLAPLQHAALAISGKPEQIEVEDGHDCELPQACPWDAEQVRACFNHAGRTHLVPELSSLFGQASNPSVQH